MSLNHIQCDECGSRPSFLCSHPKCPLGHSESEIGPMDDTLPACPFCGGSNTVVEERPLNNAPRMDGKPPTIISATVRHWCPVQPGQPTGLNIQMHGRDRASAIAAWRHRVDDQWKPIASAPRDGRTIIIGRPEGGDHIGLSLPGRWLDAVPDGPDDMGHDAGFTDSMYGSFFPGRSFGNPKYRREGTQPTHWRPLPTPPAA